MLEIIGAIKNIIVGIVSILLAVIVVSVIVSKDLVKNANMEAELACYTTPPLTITVDLETHIANQDKCLFTVRNPQSTP